MSTLMPVGFSLVLKPEIMLRWMLTMLVIRVGRAKVRIGPAMVKVKEIINTKEDAKESLAKVKIKALLRQVLAPLALPLLALAEFVVVWGHKARNCVHNPNNGKSGKPSSEKKPEQVSAIESDYWIMAVSPYSPDLVPARGCDDSHR